MLKDAFFEILNARLIEETKNEDHEWIEEINYLLTKLETIPAEYIEEKFNDNLNFGNVRGFIDYYTPPKKRTTKKQETYYRLMNYESIGEKSIPVMTGSNGYVSKNNTKAHFWIHPN